MGWQTGLSEMSTLNAIFPELPAYLLKRKETDISSFLSTKCILNFKPVLIGAFSKTENNFNQYKMKAFLLVLYNLGV